MVKNMGKDRKSAADRARVYLVTGIVTAVALVAMIGVQIYSNQGSEQSQMAQAEEKLNQGAAVGQDNGTGSDTGQGDLDYIEMGFDDYTELYKEEEAQAAMADRADMYDEETDGASMTNASGEGLADESETSATIEGTVDGSSVAASSDKSALSFGSGSTISWPVQGNVLMNYSMDHSIYFATLDQYKYNPAIIIAADVNDKVLAGAESVIASIETNENTGLTVTVDLGDGYQAVYGQLKEVKKEVGDHLSADDVVGYIAEPTKYYSVEGSNLYFAMTKDGEPVNPMEFLK